MLTARLERYVRATFDAPEDVVGALRDWRISYEDDPPSERLTAAVVFVAEGRAADLAVGLEMAETDWRDLLVAAGLAHEDWPKLLDSRLGGS